MPPTPLVIPLKHIFVSPKTDSTDLTKVQASGWNANHVLPDPAAFIAAIGGALPNAGNPNGVITGGIGDLVKDTTFGQLWINTNGGTAWTALVRSDGGTVPAVLVYSVAADSNGLGLGSDPTLADPTSKVSVPYTNVKFVCMFSTTFSEPVAPTNMGIGSLRLKNATTPGYGPEFSIGETLDELINGPGASPDTNHMVWIDEFALSSTKLSDWMQGSTSGNASPLLGGSNLDGDLNSRTLSTAAISGRMYAGEFVMLCTNDTSDNTAAAAVPTNIPIFIARRRAILGAQLAIVWVIVQPTVPQPNTAAVRASMIAALSAIPGVALVYADDIPTNDDLVHFTAKGLWTLGQRQAFAMARLRGLRERIVTVPTVVGYSVASVNGVVHGEQGISGVVGTDLRAFPWQGGMNGDLMFMPVFSGAFGGSAIPTPSGWTPAAAQITTTDASTVNSRIALFTKPLAQTELDGNVPSTGGPGFPTSVTITPGGVEFMTKPFTIRSSILLPTIVAIQSFAHGAFDTAAVTATGVTTNAPNRPVFLLVMCRGGAGQSISVVNANLTGLAQIYGASYQSASGDLLYAALWWGMLAAQGPSGNFTLTSAVNANPAGFVWTM